MTVVFPPSSSFLFFDMDKLTYFPFSSKKLTLKLSWEAKREASSFLFIYQNVLWRELSPPP